MPIKIGSPIRRVIGGCPIGSTNEALERSGYTKANNMDTVNVKAGVLHKSCKACHDVHREGDGKATPYKFK